MGVAPTPDWPDAAEPEPPKEGPAPKPDWPDAAEPPKEGPPLGVKLDWPDALGPPKEKPLAEGVKLGRYSEVELTMLSRC